MKGLLRIAGELGYEVHAVHMPDGLLGGYYPDHRMICIDVRLTPNERRSVLAHEIGHAYYGHQCDSPTAERQADRYAARLLIDPALYAELERINPDQHYLADELNVTVDLIHTYERHCLTQVNGTTYALSKMGAGQWAYRAEPV